ncbi:acetylxylan esterase [Paenibacillus baekrokdamisoli]|uniref:Acetylxylan esterase n=1 Tax=Paenibacillus baekrokdamisoli TaxID=1712516 RepID=A0A3G9J031_9BACL|nr:alpha/beta fold hydrolase [Paenibacillus baekrokdamisoli]MBB3073058.1 cephalosporin-C deacetylase [Paenibacillus baekrokdamisoli]BBH21705.1 acetylxylan esterase [Paenibacillus baekrokdamisoli]
MPTIDMPLSQLQAYSGINPRPTDFDEYWERALQEMRETDSQVELIPSAFQTSTVECLDLYFTGVRGARIHAKYARPRDSKQLQPAVLRFHGYSGNAGDWNDLLGFVALGFSVFALDCRGQGGYSEDIGGVKGNTLNGHIIRGLEGHPDHLLFRHIFLDTAQLASIALTMPGIDPEQLYATGWSQGGALTLACAALEPRVRKLAPVYPFLSDYRRVWEMDLAKDAYAELRTYFRFFDPQHEREDEIFTTLGYIDIQHLAARIKGEVLLGVGLMDTVCPPSTQYAAYNKITSIKRTEIYPDYGHEGLPGLNDKIFQFFLGNY